MIPKIIHYCWLGGKKMPPLAEKCISSWKKYCPDYKIIRWDESNYDFTIQPYMREAFEEKKWGFVPDYARLDIIYQNGGIYLDTDVELLRPWDELLDKACFIGFESFQFVNLGCGFGAEKGHWLLEKMMKDYDNYHFRKPNGSLNLLPSPRIQTHFLRQYGLKDDYGKVQILHNNIYIFPQSFFCPSNRDGHPQALPDSYSVHHYMGSWLPWYRKIFIFLAHNSNKYFGQRVTSFASKVKRLIFGDL